MKATLRLLLATAVGLLGLVGVAGSAVAGTAPSGPCNNTNLGAQDDACVNNGDADGSADQSGSASSGDGVAGQVAGVVSAGDASVDATNRSSDVDVSTGNASGANAAFVDVTAGVLERSGLVPPAVCTNTNLPTGSQADACTNNGDAEGAADQSADAASGDGVGGQVIGVVTSAGGSADLVLDNESSDSGVDTGDGTFTNTSAVDSDAVVFDLVP